MSITGIIFYMSVNIVENFVSKSYAQKIIDGADAFLEEIGDTRPGYFEDNHGRTAIPKKNYGNFSDPRIKTETHKISDMLLSDSLHITQKHLEDFYGKQLNKYENIFVKTTIGANNGLHADMYKLDGTSWNDGSGREDELGYSALLYFSDYGTDFLGGEIVFPQHKLKIFPKAGTLIFFKGDLDHLHEVKTIKSGYRYAMIMFFGE